MNYLPLRIWLIVTATFAAGALIVRLAWETTFNPPISSLVMLILAIFATISINVLLIYVAIKPNQKKLKSLPVRVSVTVITTAGIVSGIVHYIRFVPSPEATAPLSVVVATLLLMSVISGYLLLLSVIWFIGRLKR